MQGEDDPRLWHEIMMTKAAIWYACDVCLSVVDRVRVLCLHVERIWA